MSATGHRVLLIDDDAFAFKVVKLLLEEIDSPLQLEWADGFDRGLERLLQGEVDVCLLDYQLGDRSGLELLRAAADRGCQTPIVMLTARTDRELDVEAMKAGAVDFLVKGEFGAPILERVVRYAAERASTQQAIARNAAEQLRTIEELNKGLDAKVLARTRELEHANQLLSGSMSELRNTTLRLAEAKREALEKELAVARAIQASMVPRRGPLELGLATVSGLLEPASFCGGDFWLYGEAPERLMLFIGDVTGHGVGSAMIAATARSCVDTLWHEQRGRVSLDHLMAALNDVIYRASRGEFVMTAFAVEVDAAAHGLRYSVAGHLPQYLVKTSGPKVELTSLRARAVQLGDSPRQQFTVQQLEYRPGDRLVLYTDGLTEAVDAHGAEWGDRRLRQVLTDHGRATAQRLVEKLMAGVAGFTAGHPAEDDITLVAAELK